MTFTQRVDGTVTLSIGFCPVCNRPRPTECRRERWPLLFSSMCADCWDDAEGYCLSFDDTLTLDRFAAWQVMVRS